MKFIKRYLSLIFIFVAVSCNVSKNIIITVNESGSFLDCSIEPSIYYINREALIEKAIVFSSLSNRLDTINYIYTVPPDNKQLTGVFVNGTEIKSPDFFTFKKYFDDTKCQKDYILEFFGIDFPLPYINNTELEATATILYSDYLYNIERTNEGRKLLFENINQTFRFSTSSLIGLCTYSGNFIKVMSYEITVNNDNKLTAEKFVFKDDENGYHCILIRNYYYNKGYLSKIVWRCIYPDYDNTTSVEYIKTFSYKNG